MHRGTPLRDSDRCESSVFIPSPTWPNFNYLCAFCLQIYDFSRHGKCRVFPGRDGTSSTSGFPRASVRGGDSEGSISRKGVGGINRMRRHPCRQGTSAPPRPARNRSSASTGGSQPRSPGLSTLAARTIIHKPQVLGARPLPWTQPERYVGFLLPLNDRLHRHASIWWHVPLHSPPSCTKWRIICESRLDSGRGE